MFLVIRGRHQHADIATEHFGFRIAEQSLCSPIEGLNPPLRVDHDDAVDSRVDDGVEPFSA
jgi:hypothetical protein